MVVENFAQPELDHLFTEPVGTTEELIAMTILFIALAVYGWIITGSS